MTTPNGIVLYRGPSMIDGAPIVAIATGFAGKSRNAKTGDMIQTWILRDDVSPVQAIKTGQDESICGDCMHRPSNGGSCYVKVFQAPRSVWESDKRGIYPMAADLETIANAGAGRVVRLGSYGDPAAVPVAIWKVFTSRAEAWTGYTHQWRSSPDLAPYCMASVDNEGEAITARSNGWRTFRIRVAGARIALREEFICPASEEAGRKTDCASCKACMGTSGKARVSPVIIAHGATARRFALHANGAPV